MIYKVNALKAKSIVDENHVEVFPSLVYYSVHASENVNPMALRGEQITENQVMVFVNNIVVEQNRRIPADEIEAVPRLQEEGVVAVESQSVTIED